MMMQEIGVGLIGYGLGGRAFHAPYVVATPGMVLRAVVSRDPAKVHAGLPGMQVVPDVDALLALPGIDLVIVCSPDELHADHAIAALRAGKHVLVDKPFATTLADARWDADFRTLRRLIAEGRLGEIIQFESHFDRWRPTPATTWKDVRAAGIWQDLGPHLIDQALCLFGKPEGVSADIAALREGAASPDYFHVTLRYPRHRVLLHATKQAAAHGLRFVVHGTGGSWIKHGTDGQEAATVAGQRPEGADWGVDPQPGHLTDATGDSHVIMNERGDYRLFWQALADAIRGEGANPVPADEAIAVMEILEAGLRSSAERREIQP
ncbi:MAG: Gfo/Idh/MocA family oxidoreductase [Sphingobium yanoikuyae]